MNDNRSSRYADDQPSCRNDSQTSPDQRSAALQEMPSIPWGAYHHTVIYKSTPYGDFTKRCSSGSIARMSKKDPKSPLRRQKLRRWIQEEIGGNQSLAAKQAGKAPNQINELINSDTRSFGAKLARELEASMRMPAFYLDTETGSDSHTESVPKASQSNWPWDFKRDDFDSLSFAQQEKIGYFIRGMISAFLSSDESTITRETPKKTASSSET